MKYGTDVLRIMWSTQPIGKILTKSLTTSSVLVVTLLLYLPGPLRLIQKKNTTMRYYRGYQTNVKSFLDINKI